MGTGFELPTWITTLSVSCFPPASVTVNVAVNKQGDDDEQGGPFSGAE